MPNAADVKPSTLNHKSVAVVIYWTVLRMLNAADASHSTRNSSSAAI